MISCGLTKDFGVLAADSAFYDAVTKKTEFMLPKLSLLKGKYLVSFVGDTAYFSQIDYSKFNNDLASLSLYLQKYLQEMRENVEKALKELKVEQKARLCMFVLGVYNKKPTLVQLNSFLDFKPKYLFSDGDIKFATIYYGDDSKKNEIFKSSTAYMEKKVKAWKNMVSPGIVGEILTRGIYKKADMEMKAFGKKYAGGAVSVASLLSSGEAFGLSNVRV